MSPPSDSRERIHGIVITHGRLGEELMRTAEAILGPQEDVIVRSNAGLSHADLIKQIEKLISAPDIGGGPVILFVDLSAGSCGHACATVAARHPQVLLACGVNLPMLLEFLYHRERVGRGELRDRILRKGREGVRCVGWNGDH